MWKGDTGDVTLRGQGHGGNRVRAYGRLRRSESGWFRGVLAVLFFIWFFVLFFVCSDENSFENLRLVWGYRDAFRVACYGV